MVRGDDGEVIGDSQIIVFENKSGSRTDKDGKLGAKGIIMSIYLPGEKIKLR